MICMTIRTFRLERTKMCLQGTLCTPSDLQNGHEDKFLECMQPLPPSAQQTLQCTRLRRKFRRHNMQCCHRRTALGWHTCGNAQRRMPHRH